MNMSCCKHCPKNPCHALCTNGKDTYHEFNMRNYGACVCGEKNYLQKSKLGIIKMIEKLLDKLRD